MAASNPTCWQTTSGVPAVGPALADESLRAPASGGGQRSKEEQTGLSWRRPGQGTRVARPEGAGRGCRKGLGGGGDPSEGRAVPGPWSPGRVSNVGRHSPEAELGRGGGRGKGKRPGGEPQVLEDGLGRRGTEDDRHDGAGAPAARAGEDVGLEGPLEELGPGDAGGEAAGAGQAPAPPGRESWRGGRAPPGARRCPQWCTGVIRRLAGGRLRWSGRSGRAGTRSAYSSPAKAGGRARVVGESRRTTSVVVTRGA